MTTPERTDVVSPELVLVDPDLALLARARLAEPGDTLARLKPSSRAGPERPSPGPANGRLPPPFGQEADVAFRRLAKEALAATLPEPAPVRWPPRTRVAAVAAGLSAAIAVAVLMAGAWMPLADAPRTVEPSSGVRPVAIEPGEPTGDPGPIPPKAKRAGPPARPATPKPSLPKRRGAPPTPRVSPPRLFAWAPDSNASGYHMELFRGSDRIFTADTTRPQITIPPVWRLEGRTYRLAPGEYRWYVWPLVAGRRVPEAIVQATLVVSPG